MIIVIILSIACIILNSLSLLGLSDSPDVLKIFSWTHVTFQGNNSLNYELHVGLRGISEIYYN